MDTVVFSVFDEETKKQLEKTQEQWRANNIIVPIPKLGDKVSFPVACVTGVCFRGDGPCLYRWDDNIGLLCFYDNEWEEAGEHAVRYFTKVTVVEEPKPEPVWKDCNFIEAWNHMEKGGVARVDDALYSRTTYTKIINRELYSLNTNGQPSLNIGNIFKIGAIVEGKWQIKVS